jgi:hypothetical protein
MGHTSHSPSGYDRWSICTASVHAIGVDRETGLIPKDDQGSEAAREGTAAHQLFAIALDMRVSPRTMIGSSIYVEDLGENWVVDAEMGEEVDRSYEYVMEHLSPNATMWVEKKLSLNKVLPEQKGTADVTLLPVDAPVLHVFDLKYGKGKHVEVVDNNQTKLYAIGAFDNLLTYEQKKWIKEIRLHIVQPRTGNIASWSMSKRQMELFRVEAHGKYQESIDPDLRTFVSGRHCWFCDRRFRCIHLIKRFIEMATGKEIARLDEIGDLDDFRNPDSFTDEELAQMWPMLDFLGAWANNMKKFMDAEAARGRNFPGLKLVEGRKGNRKWKDEDQVDKYLQEKGLDDDQRYKKSLATVAQAEKIIGRKNLDDDFKELFDQSAPKPTLAAADDPRIEYNQVLLSEFD